jgi:phosphoglucosamine mutase
VRVAQHVDLADADPVWQCVREVESDLGAAGRVLVRASGTEPLVRIMVEAPTHSAAAGAVARIRRVVEAEFGAASPP